MDMIENVKARFIQLHSILYKGLFIGLFFPSGVGIDVYRVISVKKEYGTYKSNISTIFLEKLIGTVSSLLLILCCYPFLGLHENQTISNIIPYVYLFVGIIFSCLILIGFKSNIIRGRFALVLNKFAFFLNERIIRLINKILKNNEPIEQGEDVVRDILKPLLSLKYIGIVLFFFCSDTCG